VKGCLDIMPLSGWSLFLSLGPAITFGVSAYLIGRDWSWWKLWLICLVAFGLGLLGLNLALMKACHIGEAECLRTGSASVLVWIIWGSAALPFIVRSIMLSRATDRVNANSDGQS
jgi:hypothetical protein